MARKVGQVLSHWNHFIDGLNQSSLEVYGSLEQALEKRQLPKTDTSHVDQREGNIFSARREYLRVEHRDFIFDICAAPFGTGFFFSWWLGEAAPSGLWGLLLSIPILGVLLQRLVKPITYWRMDTALMVQEAVHAAVLEIVDSLTTAKGLRALSELERKPIMKDLFKF